MICAASHRAMVNVGANYTSNNNDGEATETKLTLMMMIWMKKEVSLLKKPPSENQKFELRTKKKKKEIR